MAAIKGMGAVREMSEREAQEVAAQWDASEEKCKLDERRRHLVSLIEERSAGSYSRRG